MPCVDVVVRASPELVYDLVSDVTAMGRWSPETEEAHWVGPATVAAPGVRFVGRNRRRRAWSTTCTVTEADRGRRFAFQVGKGETTWVYDFTAVADGCRVTESFEVVRPPGMLGRWLTKQGVGLPWADREQDLVEGMRVTLDRLKAAAEATT